VIRAEAGGRRLETLPVNVMLLGVVVPPGTHRVRVSVSAAPEIAAAAVGLLALAAALALGLRPGRRGRETEAPV
jgi:hypothetical protein